MTGHQQPFWLLRSPRPATRNMEESSYKVRIESSTSTSVDGRTGSCRWSHIRDSQEVCSIGDVVAALAASMSRAAWSPLGYGGANVELDIFFPPRRSSRKQDGRVFGETNYEAILASDIPYIRKHRPLDSRQSIVANDIRELSAFADLMLSVYLS